MRKVSIAGAILWGVLHTGPFQYLGQWDSFNRRGDSLGGAAPPKQFQSKFVTVVSIAGAILWGVLPPGGADQVRGGTCFNRRGDSLGGAAWL